MENKKIWKIWKICKICKICRVCKECTMYKNEKCGKYAKYFPLRFSSPPTNAFLSKHFPPSTSPNILLLFLRQIFSSLSFSVLHVINVMKSKVLGPHSSFNLTDLFGPRILLFEEFSATTVLLMRGVGSYYLAQMQCLSVHFGK